MRIIAIVLIAVGALILGYQGFSYIKRDTVAEVGGVKLTADHKETVWVPPVIGGVAVVAGVAMLLTARKAEA